MKRWQTATFQGIIIAVFTTVLAAVPAYCQHGMLGISGGLTSDRYGALTRYQDGVGIIDGRGIVWKSPDKVTGADIEVGGEVRIPSNTNTHAKEFSVFGGPAFRFGEHWSVGFHAQIHWFYQPPSINIPSGIIVGTTFYRPRMWILEPPGFVQYKFGADNHWFVRAEGGPEFSPHYKFTVATAYPNPNLDHGYTVRGTVGRNFGSWYIKGSYETRYFKFRSNFGNPGNFYNWRSDMATAGVGVSF